MSINPASDIVLDVAKAADPVKALAATVRLKRLGEADPQADVDFGTFVAARQPESAEIHSRLAPIGTVTKTTRSAGDDPKRAIEGLEQLVLQKLVESMLPKEAPTTFGRGIAGDVWRSILAEQLAAQIASTVDLGIGRAMPNVTSSRAAISHDDAGRGGDDQFHGRS